MKIMRMMVRNFESTSRNRVSKWVTVTMKNLVRFLVNCILTSSLSKMNEFTFKKEHLSDYCNPISINVYLTFTKTSMISFNLTLLQQFRISQNSPTSIIYYNYILFSQVNLPECHNGKKFGFIPAMLISLSVVQNYLWQIKNLCFLTPSFTAYKIFDPVKIDFFIFLQFFYN